MKWILKIVMCDILKMHKPFLSMEFAYLHEECGRCGKELKMIASYEELVSDGIIQHEAVEMEPAIKEELKRILNRKHNDVSS